MFKILIITAIILSSIPSVTYYERVEPIIPIKIEVSAYSSEIGQTDDTPHITASNKAVGDGIVANNCLPFGTKVLIGDKIYVVEDRMNKRYGCERFDIWVSSRAEAMEWGVKTVNVLVL